MVNHQPAMIAATHAKRHPPARIRARRKIPEPATGGDSSLTPGRNTLWQFLHVIFLPNASSGIGNVALQAGHCADMDDIGRSLGGRSWSLSVFRGDQLWLVRFIRRVIIL